MNSDVDRHEPVACSNCGTLMALARKVPKLGGLPELWSFKCRACGAVETHEADLSARPVRILRR
jgi:hypothetical protein